MAVYSEFRFWSVVMDRDAVRISVPGQNAGDEYFCIIPAYEGRRYRDRRDEALDLISSAIRQNLPPGEVVPA